MRTLISKPGVAVLLALAGVLAGCKIPPLKAPLKPPVVSMRVTVGAAANPDQSGKAAPVVVRLYQLKDDAAFSAADFFALYDDEMKTLGPALIERREFELAPGEQRSFDYPVTPDAHFIGAIAAFRDIRNAQWRALAPAPKLDPQKKPTKIQLAIAVDRLQITLSTTK